MSPSRALRHTRTNNVSRRALFRGGAALATAGLVPGAGLTAAPALALSFGKDMYESIGVRPVINAKGVFTMLSGSLMLPECRQAMQQASRNFVHIDELMESVGKRLAEITGAESAIVTTGCAAALAHATAACLAGGDPEKIHRLPDLTGLKDEVVVPHYSRNIYDQSIRMVGPKIISVDDEDQLRRAINDRTAMALVVGSPRDQGPFGLTEVASIAHEYDVPVLMDAAAEALSIPQRPSQARRRLGCLQRRQGPIGSSEFRPTHRPQGPHPGRVAQQRPAPRFWTPNESRQRRHHGPARRRRNLGPSRS